MPTLNLLALLAASAVTAGPPAEPEMFVTQLRIPARDAVLDTFAWRDGDAVFISRDDAANLGFAIPPDAGDRVPLGAIPGLTYQDDQAQSALIIACEAACFATQLIANEPEPTPELTHARGAYLNYDAQVQSVDGDTAFAGLGEGVLFNRHGRLEMSALAQNRNITRLESSWVMDRQDDMLRLRLGDSAFQRSDGAILRFGGIQLGRAFGLQPSLITRPSPTLSGTATSASTVDLYIDGVIQSRHRVEAGPFVVNQPALIEGGGEAQLVVTDLLGRASVVTRPFFISSTMLRPGFSDWALAAGAVRNEYGESSADYGPSFAAARYRRGLTNAITAEAGVEGGDEQSSADMSVDIAHDRLGLLHVSRAQGGDGGATEIGWQVDTRNWTAGLRWSDIERGFQRLGADGTAQAERTTAGSFSIDLGNYGAVSITAARIESDLPARTAQMVYEPSFADGALLFRAAYAERENQESAFEIGVSLSITLRDDLSADSEVRYNESGIDTELSMQRTTGGYRGLDWRARVATGSFERADVGARHAGAGGESSVEIARVGEINAARIGHAGSVGIVEGRMFAGRAVQGGFTLVDVGAPGVTVARNGESAGASDRRGLVLITRMQPYERNIVRIEADDLPPDWAPQQDRIDIALAEGAGAFLAFDARSVRFTNAHARYADGAFPQRGAVLTRTRDGARFPIGANGRVVLTGALPGDSAQLDVNPLCRADIGGDNPEITITCEAEV